MWLREKDRSESHYRYPPGRGVRRAAASRPALTVSGKSRPHRPRTQALKSARGYRAKDIGRSQFRLRNGSPFRFRRTRRGQSARAATRPPLTATNLSPPIGESTSLGSIWTPRHKIVVVSRPPQELVATDSVSKSLAKTGRVYLDSRPTVFWCLLNLASAIAFRLASRDSGRGRDDSRRHAWPLVLSAQPALSAQRLAHPALPDTAVGAGVTTTAVGVGGTARARGVEATHGRHGPTAIPSSRPPPQPRLGSQPIAPQPPTSSSAAMHAL